MAVIAMAADVNDDTDMVRRLAIAASSSFVALALLPVLWNGFSAKGACALVIHGFCVLPASEFSALLWS